MKGDNQGSIAVKLLEEVWKIELWSESQIHEPERRQGLQSWIINKI